jgi:hypothetical protein
MTVGAPRKNGHHETVGRMRFNLPSAQNAETRRGKRRRARVKPDAIAGLVHVDPAKAFAMACIGQFVTNGHAEWHMLGNGDIRLRLHTGETYLLTEAVIVRVA